MVDHINPYRREEEFVVLADDKTIVVVWLFFWISLCAVSRLVVGSVLGIAWVVGRTRFGLLWLGDQALGWGYALLAIIFMVFQLNEFNAE